MADWLADHDVDDGWQHRADAGGRRRRRRLVRARRRRSSTAPPSEPGLEWVAGTLTTRTLLGEMKESTGRISGLVGSVRSYSQVDRATVQLVDVTEGIESTLVMLKHKIAGRRSRWSGTTPPTCRGSRPIPAT